MEVCEQGEQFNEALQTKIKELEEANQLRAKQARKIAALEAEVTTLRQGKEEADMRLATSNSRVDELENKVANLEFSSTQALSESESLKKDKTDLLQQKKALEDQLAHLPQQSIEAENRAVVEFRRSQLFEENMLLLHGSAMEVGQTKTIDVRSEVCPQLDKEDPRLTELYSSTAAQEFNTQFKQFLDEADLRGADE